MAPVAAPPFESAPEPANLLRTRFLRDHPDQGDKLDEILLVFDRDLDPLTLRSQRFRVVSGDRRVQVIAAAHFADTKNGQRNVLLLGRFGDDPASWSRSLAVLPGLFAADGRPVKSSGVVPIAAPLPKEDP